MEKQKSFIAVHAGAGYHSTNKETEYRSVCKDACKQAMEILHKGGNAVEAVTKAVSVLEDSPLTNAGLGSSLTLEGCVECDASVMDGRTLTSGAVGCVMDVQNPVQVAERLVQTQVQGGLSHGRIPPSILVAHGARQWADQQDITLTADAGHVTESSRRTYLKYKRKLANQTSTSENKETAEDTTHKRVKTGKDELECGECSGVQDTVGCVCVDGEGNMAAACSSGGIWMKHTGRMGPAAHYGVGSWAHNGCCNKTPGVAVVSSGGGEHLIKTFLAKTCADRVQKEPNASLAVSSAFKDNFLESEFLSHVEDKHGGVLVLKHLMEDDGYREAEVLWAHTTDSMCVGYMLETHSKPTTFISRLPAASLPGKSFAMEGKNFKL
ncbi:threonine aspartase 1-like [Haliotis cracherodii]|uniref:threonine aspartase 1-like n=1 Tax=Haliotis cracherodii TaxID=6455 RepID=UPI0039EC7F83